MIQRSQRRAEANGLTIPTQHVAVAFCPVGPGHGDVDQPYGLGLRCPTGAGDPASAPHSALAQNAPNPFNPQTVIRYTIADTGPVQLEVYDVSGSLVRVLVDGVRESRATPYNVTWDGRDESGETVASGVYFYRLIAPGIVQTKKMVLLK